MSTSAAETKVQGTASRVVNLTPHAIVIFGAGGNDLITTIESQGVARVSEKRSQMKPVHGTPVWRVRLQDAVGLPEQSEGVHYLVSQTVALAIGSTRQDLLSPDTGSGAVRNAAGQVIGTTGFVVYR